MVCVCVFVCACVCGDTCTTLCLHLLRDAWLLCAVLANMVVQGPLI